MSKQTGLICAYALDGKGGGKELDWSAIRDWTPEDGVLWVHLDYDGNLAREWLYQDSGVAPITLEALLARQPRPRGFPDADGLMLIIRGVNLNEGANPEDMVSLRMWVEGDRIITMRHRKVQAIKTVRRSLEEGKGPICVGDFLCDTIHQILDRIAVVVDDLDDSIAHLEDEVLRAESYEMRHGVADLRRQAIALRRYVGPERDVLARLESHKVSWLNDDMRARLREAADRLTRSVEDLDAARDRAVVTQEEIASRLSELLNKRLYTLSIIAAIFLPLGFVTGLMGVNVGGIPGSSFEWGFLALCGFVVLLGGAQLWVFRKLGWL